MPVLIEEDLIEMGFGDLEGKLLKDCPEYQCIFSDPDRYVPLGDGESYAQLDERCRILLEEIIPPWRKTTMTWSCAATGPSSKGWSAGC